MKISGRIDVILEHVRHVGERHRLGVGHRSSRSGRRAQWLAVHGLVLLVSIRIMGGASTVTPAWVYQAIVSGILEAHIFGRWRPGRSGWERAGVAFCGVSICHRRHIKHCSLPRRDQGTCGQPVQAGALPWRHRARLPPSGDEISVPDPYCIGHVHQSNSRACAWTAQLRRSGSGSISSPPNADSDHPRSGGRAAG